MVGHKLGEFSFTRKVGRVHEKKFKNKRGTLKKLNKKGNETAKTVSKKINDKRKNAKK
jgi:Ribosomal protein S19